MNSVATGVILALDDDDYDDEVLAVVCPECKASVGAKCLVLKAGGMGGKMWRSAPHRIRVAEARQKRMWG